ncbi:MAG: sulfite exporter TauE/SafE family protein [Elusimicrobiota bacterium]
MVELNFLYILILVFFGILIGILGSVMGVGGGVFIVPFLTLVFHIPIKSAIAISLLSIIATSSSVASINVEKGITNVRLGTFMEMPMALGSIVSTFIMLRINPYILQLLFGFMILPVALSMYYKGRKEKKRSHEKNINFVQSGKFQYYDSSLQREIYYDIKKEKIAFIFSFLGGCMSGLFGLGGGIVQVPVMNIISKIPMKVATSTSNFMIGLSACASVLILYKNGYIINDIAVFMTIGVVLGGFLGIKFLSKAKNHTLQIIFSILLMIVSLKMIWSVFR